MIYNWNKSDAYVLLPACKLLTKLLPTDLQEIDFIGLFEENDKDKKCTYSQL